MKKSILAILLAALLLSTLLPAAAFAANDKFASTFFPGGKITKPAAPYIFFEDDVYSEVNGDQMSGFFELPADVRKLNETMAKYAEITEFDAAYGTDWGYNLRLQLDSRLDNGPWQYTSVWDTASYSGAMEVNAEYYALGYLNYLDVDETDKMLKWFRFTDLSYLNPDDLEATAGWAAAAIYPDGEVYRLDFANHTFSYRYRYLIEYLLADEDEPRYLLSDWSDTVSIGKNGTLKPLTAPTAMPAPVLSEFKNASIDSEGNSYAEFYMDIPQTYYDGNAYYEVLDNMWDNVYCIHCEMKVNGEAWNEIEVGNNTWLSNGYRSLFYDKLNVTPDDAIQIRVRMEDLYTGKFSPYSNVVGTKVFDASNWAQTGIQQAAADGLFPECLEGTDLTKIINRREFAAVAVKLYEAMSATELTADPSVSFTDCNDADVLKAATKVGGKSVVSGYTDGSFKPEVLLNRETAATMLGNVYLMLNGYSSILDVRYDVPAKFSDDKDLSTWASSYVYLMNSKGVISGFDNKNGSFSFRPKNLTNQNEAYGMCTREQALIIAEQMFQKMK